MRKFISGGSPVLLINHQLDAFKPPRGGLHHDRRDHDQHARQGNKKESKPTPYHVKIDAPGTFSWQLTKASYHEMQESLLAGNWPRRQIGGCHLPILVFVTCH
ncbi:hypothetical protein [Antarctobacter jejuensis]|uniref:hypothetical protein n=1 Tax=Antarctobacter jejuensis TaxID=1439938 RepID=UPI003FD0A307